MGIYRSNSGGKQSGVASPRRVVAVDLFCGAGGLTRGLLDAGVQVVAGYDLDRACRFPYEHNNPPAVFKAKNVANLKTAELARHYPCGAWRVLVGCAPCQPFSKYTQGLDSTSDERWGLLAHFGRLVNGVRPHIVSMENVPELKRHRVYNEFVSILRKLGYHVAEHEAFCPDYGIPQCRTRLVLIASLIGPITLEGPTHKQLDYRTVRLAIGGLPPLSAGAVNTSDALHRSSSLSQINLARIRISRPGGSWRDWPKILVAKCHRKKRGKTYPSVYGRMEWDKPSPTITTQFYGFGNGRFGHPDQDRALSLREGAILQSFPLNYEFIPPGADISFKNLGRMIGNAVPVRLGEVVGTTIMHHFRQYEQ